MALIFLILFYASIYILLALSFSIQYNATRFINIINAIIFSFSAYLTYFFYIANGLPIFLSILFSLFINSIVGILLWISLLEPLRKRNSSSLVLFLVSLGIYIIIQNIISLVWGDNPKSLNQGSFIIGSKFLDFYISKIQVIILLVAIFLFLGFIALLKKTKLGSKINAIITNEELANIYGINSYKILIWIILFSTNIAAIAGILIAFYVNIVPAMGFNLLLIGIIPMIIGGIGSTWGLIWGSLLIATAQNLVAYYIDSKWMDAIAYIILIIFLIFRPLGFSGKQLKKTEI